MPPGGEKVNQPMGAAPLKGKVALLPLYDYTTLCFEQSLLAAVMARAADEELTERIKAYLEYAHTYTPTQGYHLANYNRFLHSENKVRIKAYLLWATI